MSLPTFLDAHDLAETGWGVIFSQYEDPAVAHALRPLLQRRQEQAGPRFRELTQHPGESALRFLSFRHGEAPGVLDPDVLPYYLLIVGGPEAISFEFQYHLAINHAVGRIAFDAPSDYERYADAVLQAENRGVDLPRRTTIFSVEHEGDQATAILAEHLVKPLSERLSGFAEWDVDVWAGERSRKRDLSRLLGGEATPGLLLASCHGVRKAPGAADQTSRQGALLCNDWPGNQCVPTPDHSFGGADLGEVVPRLHGLIAYFFSCYSAGTPLEDSFPHETPEGMRVGRHPRRAVAHRPFVAQLPQALLSRGALAVVGRIDRGWTTSFLWHFRGIRVEAIRDQEDSLKRLLAGSRIGHALRPMVSRYAAIAGQLTESMERVRNNEAVDEEMVSFQWTAHNDARNLVLLGDPAVYLLGRRCWALSDNETIDLQKSAPSRRAEGRVQVGSLFISYSHRDEAFVEAIEGRFDAKGIHYWRDVHDLKAGRVERQIDRGLQLNPTVLLVLSKDSVESDWVRWEAEKARELEKKLDHDVLCPVALDDSWMHCAWPGHLRQQIEDYYILSFANWEDDTVMSRQFAKLLEGLALFYERKKA